MTAFERNLVDVYKLIEHAKLHKEDLLPVFQTLVFSEEIGEDSSTLLLELDGDVLDTINAGDSVVVRGDKEDTAVLCTKGKTYEIREAETSNSLLFLPGVLLPESMKTDSDYHLRNCEVVGIHCKYLEIRPCKPRLRKLQALLMECPFSDIKEYETGGECYSWDDLMNRVQCSEEELAFGLEQMKTFYTEGCYRLLDFDYHFKLVSLILNEIEANSWSLDAVPKEAIIQSLGATQPRHILEQCFEYYLTDTGSKSPEGHSLYRLKDDDVSRLCAEVLLRPAGKFNLNEFLKIWQQSVPEGVVTSLAQLDRIALIDKDSSPPVISHVPVTMLPDDIGERFAVLFDLRSKWSYDEIQPFLVDLASEKTPVSALLTKFARTSMQNGIRYYTARHAR